MSSTTSSLWRHPDFLKLWTGETVSLLGSQITLLALPLTAVLVLNATPFEMGLLGALEFLPFLFLSLFAGVWADRLPRRPILMTANLGRALLLGLVPLAAVTGWLNMSFLYVIAVAVGCLTVFFDVAYQAYLPVLVERDQLVEGNSKLEATRSLTEMAGPALAGLLVQRITAPLAIAVDAASFLFSAGSLVLIRRGETPMPKAARQPVLREIREGLAVVLGNPVLRAIAACTGTSNFFSNVRFAVLTIYAVRGLGIQPGTLGLILSVGGVGALLGALQANRIARRWGVGPTVIGAMLVGGIGALAVPAAQAPLAFAVVMLTAGQLITSAVNPVYNITQVSLRQAITPLRLQGRMNATMRFLVWGTIPLGSLAGGALGEWIGVRPTLVVGAIGALLPVLWVYFSPVRGLRDMPVPADEGVPAEVRNDQ